MHVVLLCSGASAATRAAAFPGDEPVDEPLDTGWSAPAGADPAAVLSALLAALDPAGSPPGRGPGTARVVTAPSRHCRRTAELLGLAATTHPGPAGCDFGRWTGRTLHEVMTDTPEAVTDWLRDPDATPHGGESLRTLGTRIGRWLDGLTTPSADGLTTPSAGGRTGPSGAGRSDARAGTGAAATVPATVLAVVDAAVVRAAVTHALGADTGSGWRIDVTPLTSTVLVGHPGRWSLRAHGVHLPGDRP